MRLTAAGRRQDVADSEQAAPGAKAGKGAPKVRSDAERRSTSGTTRDVFRSVINGFASGVRFKHRVRLCGDPFAKVAARTGHDDEFVLYAHGQGPGYVV